MGASLPLLAYTLIKTVKLNKIDPQTWLTDVLGRIADHKINRIDEAAALELYSTKLSIVETFLVGRPALPELTN